MLILSIAALSLLLFLLVVAYVLWNLTIDYRKLDCSCMESPGYLWLACRALWRAVLKRQGETAHGEWSKALNRAVDSGSNEQTKGKHVYGQLQKLQRALQIDWLALR